MNRLPKQSEVSEEAKKVGRRVHRRVVLKLLEGQAKRIEQLEADNAALKQENEGLRNGGRRLLSALPDSVAHENPDCWEWCWNELDGDAQDEVKEVRNYWNNILLTKESDR